MKFLEQQITIAKDNYNYFFMKMIFEVFKIIFKLSIMLLISYIYNFLIINIITLIYSIYAIYCIYFVFKYYINIITDIKVTLGYDDFSFVFDVSFIRYNIFKRLLKYGK